MDGSLQEGLWLSAAVHRRQTDAGALPKERLINVLLYGVIFGFCAWMWASGGLLYPLGRNGPSGSPLSPWRRDRPYGYCLSRHPPAQDRLGGL